MKTYPHPGRSDSPRVTIPEAVLCSVCIATYRRPALLRKLLSSLASQKLPPNVTLEIIIVDNDAEQSAASVVREYAESAAHPVHYFVQPEKNISITRNLAVAKARGTFLLFIDDDEVAAPQWVQHLYAAICHYEADAVFGRREPYFPENTPFRLRRPEFYYPQIGPSGSRARFWYTSNCIVRAELLKKMDPPFDPAYGITGGEDMHLFQRLYRQGKKLVNCREAVVLEYIPPERATISHIFLRSLRGGNSHTRRILENTAKPGLKRLILIGKSLALGTLSLMGVTLFLPDAYYRTISLKKLGANLGRLLAALRYHYEGYR